MASAEKHGKSWRACWYIGKVDGRSKYVKQGGFISEQAALRFAAGKEAELVRGIDTEAGKQTWGQWCDTWLATRLIETSTDKAQTPVLRKWVRPTWDPVPLNRISRDAIRTWIASMAKLTSAWTVDKAFHILSASLTAALEAELIASNPASRLTLPTKPTGTERFFERHEIDEVLGKLSQPYHDALMMLPYTGLRFGEMAGLHWHRVDLDTQNLRVVEVWSDAAGKIMPYPKGRQGGSRKNRSVPIPDNVAEMLTLRLEANGGPGRKCYQEHHSGVCRSGLVFPAPHGGVLDIRNVRTRHWYTALEAAGLSHGRQHDLRHTYASWLAQDGVSMQDIAKALGHTVAYVTERYVHLADTHLDRVRESMNGGQRIPKRIPNPLRKIN
jgi:integrase